MNPGHSRRALVAAAAAMAVVAIGCVAAQAAPAERQACFRPGDVFSFTDVDRTTVNLKVRVNQYYQLKIWPSCPHIDWSLAIGIRHRGSDWICTGADAELVVPNQGIGPEYCPVTSIRRMTPEEVAALPSRHKP